MPKFRSNTVNIIMQTVCSLSNPNIHLLQFLFSTAIIISLMLLYFVINILQGDYEAFHTADIDGIIQTSLQEYPDMTWHVVSYVGVVFVVLQQEIWIIKCWNIFALSSQRLLISNYFNNLFCILDNSKHIIFFMKNPTFWVKKGWEAGNPTP